MTTKFDKGDKVTHVGDSSKQVRKVLSIHIKEDGIYYDVTSREVDIVAKELIEGHMYVKENELRAHKED